MSADRIKMRSVPRTATCTVGPKAGSDERCGKPAVVGFWGSDNQPYFECAQHVSAASEEREFCDMSGALVSECVGCKRASSGSGSGTTRRDLG